ncbi:MAG: hypothetical protein LLF97_08655 [Planctomycetaceae bacterium]|nr:hypothetical protein [Planctomycetaceae bacterium]
MRSLRWMSFAVALTGFVVLGVCFGATQTPPKTASQTQEDGSRAILRELASLRQRVKELSDAVDKLERRVLQVEQHTQTPRSPTASLRPLGDDLQVDQDGIIWQKGRPVGVWGVNGDRDPSSSIR